MIAQQGTFTVHGTEKLRLDEWIAEISSKPEEMLCKVVLENLSKDQTLLELRALGVKRHTIYPDLINYVAHLRECYNW